MIPRSLRSIVMKAMAKLLLLFCLGAFSAACVRTSSSGPAPEQTGDSSLKTTSSSFPMGEFHAHGYGGTDLAAHYYEIVPGYECSPNQPSYRSSLSLYNFSYATQDGDICQPTRNVIDLAEINFSYYNQAYVVFSNTLYERRDTPPKDEAMAAHLFCRSEGATVHEGTDVIMNQGFVTIVIGEGISESVLGRDGNCDHSHGSHTVATWIPTFVNADGVGGRNR